MMNFTIHNTPASTIEIVMYVSSSDQFEHQTYSLALTEKDEYYYVVY